MRSYWDRPEARAISGYNPPQVCADIWNTDGLFFEIPQAFLRPIVEAPGLPSHAGSVAFSGSDVSGIGIVKRMKMDRYRKARALLSAMRGRGWGERRLWLVFALIAPASLSLQCTPGKPAPGNAVAMSCPRGADYEYVHEDVRLCGLLPTCSRGVPFRNSCGCGCHVERSAVDPGYTVCGDGQRSVKYCKEEYAPVCGWFTATPDQCADRYCRETYANSCFACKDRRVSVFSPSNCSI